VKPLRQTLGRGPVFQVPRCELSDGKQRVAPQQHRSRRSSLLSEGGSRHRCKTNRPPRAVMAARGTPTSRRASPTLVAGLWAPAVRAAHAFVTNPFQSTTEGTT
jgi:hypothetical protein